MALFKTETLDGGMCIGSGTTYDLLTISSCSLSKRALIFLRRLRSRVFLSIFESTRLDFLALAGRARLVDAELILSGAAVKLCISSCESSVRVDAFQAICIRV